MRSKWGGFEIDVPTITGDGRDWPYLVGDELEVEIPWKRPGQALKDTFTITFPDALVLPTGDIEMGEPGSGLGTCKADQASKTLTCTLQQTDKFNVNGTLKVQVKAAVAPKKDVTFKYGDTDVPAELPNIVNPKDQYDPVKELTKTGGFLPGSSDRILDWEILIPGELFEGKTSVKIVDSIPGDFGKHEFILDGRSAYSIIGEELKPTFTGEGTELEIEVPTPQGESTCASDPAEVCPPDVAVYVRSEYTGNGVPPLRTQFSNTVTIQDGGQTATGAVTVGGLSSPVAFVDSGSFKLTKTIEPKDATCLSAAEAATYDVRVTIKLPQGITSEFSGTAKAKGSAVLEKTPNQIAYTEQLSPQVAVGGYDSLPAGSTVTIEEQGGQKDGFIFTPDSTKIIEIDPAKNVDVALVNKVTCIPTQTVTTTATESTVVTETQVESTVITETKEVPTTINGTPTTITETVTSTKRAPGTVIFVTETVTVPTTINGTPTTVTSTVVKESTVTTTVPTPGAGGSSVGERCVPVVLGVTIPLALLIPVAILSQMGIPGLEPMRAELNDRIGELNSRIQQSLGIYQDDLARLAQAITPEARRALGVAGIAALLTALAGTIAAACIPTDTNAPAEPVSSSL